jgi:hypothetical protein
MNPSAQHPIVATIPSNDRGDHVVHAPKALADPRNTICARLPSL